MPRAPSHCWAGCARCAYGSKVSYFTGKLEAYLRFKGFEYQRLPATPHRRAIRKHVGAIQMPVVELDDGRWLSDSTPTIALLETLRPEPAGSARSLAHSHRAGIVSSSREPGGGPAGA